MDPRGQRVVVPVLVGLTLDARRQMASEGGVVLVAADPDGPPLGVLAWPGEFLITGQSPAPGTGVPRWDGVVVTFRPITGGGSAGVREPRRPGRGAGGGRAARPLPPDAGT